MSQICWFAVEAAVYYKVYSIYFKKLFRALPSIGKPFLSISCVFFTVNFFPVIGLVFTGRSHMECIGFGPHFIIENSTADKLGHWRMAFSWAESAVKKHWMIWHDEVHSPNPLLLDKNCLFLNIPSIKF
jgi:hypothetical protein